MPVYDEMYQKFFSSESLEGKDPKVLTLKSIAPEEVGVGDDKKTQLVAYFEEDARGFVINQVNYKKLKKIFGSDDTDNWLGGKIELYHDPDITFGAKTVGGIRLRAPTS